MSEEERPFDIEFSWNDPATKKQHTAKMRKQRWIFDQSLQLKLVDPQGNPNLKELWIERIADTVEGITKEQIRKIDQFTMNVYIAKWMQYNDVTDASFLETSQSSKSSTS
jgi:hypothetical protein